MDAEDRYRDALAGAKRAYGEQVRNVGLNLNCSQTQRRSPVVEVLFVSTEGNEHLPEPQRG